jgi:hypothetical protein
MHLPTTTHNAETLPSGEAIRRHPFFRRFLVVYLVLLVFLLLALLPPLINVNRFKRRIVTSISTTLGRPVHLDSVSLNLLPLPGFTLENFVVEEDPHFGAEPIIRANSVRATLRVSSLWRRKVEFSRIALDEPSLNLVHNPDGRWNVEGILLQASQMSAAPTAQVKAGRDPRFPYIEATGARINLKSGVNGLEKLPFALTDTELALWLPTPNQWHLRLEAHPARTDTGASDTGTIEIEGTFGRAKAFDEIPLELTGQWKNAPLGEASLIVLGRDANLRGNLAVSAEIHGTLAESVVKVRTRVSDLRRAEFVPLRPIEIDAECQANATETLHAFHQVRCSWPPPSVAGQKLLALTGDLPDIHNLRSGSFEVGTPGLPASTLLNWLHVASTQFPAEESATGMVTAKLSRDTSDAGANWAGDLMLRGGTLTAAGLTAQPLVLGDLSVVSRDALPNESFVLAPTTLNLGGKDPAVLEGRFDANGYSLHLSGAAVPARLLALQAALPQFGDGFSDLFAAGGTAPVRIDLMATRRWFANGQHQPWTRMVAAVPSPSGRRRRAASKR